MTHGACIRFVLATALFAAAGAVPAAVMLASPGGFSTQLVLSDFVDGNGQWRIGLSGANGSLQFDEVSGAHDVRAFGTFTFTDNPSLVLPFTYSGESLFAGVLQATYNTNTTTVTFGSSPSTLTVGSSWTISYDGASSSIVFPMPLPVPLFSAGPLAGSLSFTVTASSATSLDLLVDEVVGTASGWTGFEDNLAIFDAFTSSIGTIDGTLDLSAGSQIVATPAPATALLFAPALGLLGLLARRGRRRRAGRQA